MKKSGLADSPFFSTSQEKQGVSTSPAELDHAAEKESEKAKRKSEKPQASKQPTTLDTTIPTNHGSMVPTNHDTKTPTNHDTIIELIRKAVRGFGKEAATHRFSIEEKKAISSIIYAYKGQGIKTSENEIARIAINFILNDYQENGKRSILHKALKALNE